MKEHAKIPRRYRQFFHWFCHPDHLEELNGDLIEQFQRNVEAHGLPYARRRYRREVIRMLRPSVLRNFNPLRSDLLSAAILRSHSKVVLRNIARHKSFSFINIAGLAVGMSISLLIITMIADLMKFDRFHENADRLYRLTSDIQIDNLRDDRLATTAMPLAGALDQLDGVDDIVRIHRYFSADATANHKILSLKGHLADSNFFDVFTFPMISGNPRTALRDPYSIVLTQHSAKKFFGDANPVGESIKMGEYGEFQITGVLKDLPQESHMQFDALGSFSTLPGLEAQKLIRSSSRSWDEVYSNYIYVTLLPGQKPSEIERRLALAIHGEYQRFDNLTARFTLQPLLGIVPGPELSNKIGPNFHPMALVILSGIALLILLSACFNYANLSIARALRRSAEVGIRKVVGASRSGIVTQFLIEAVLISMFALILAIALFQCIKPAFFQNFPQTLGFTLGLTPQLILLFVLFALLCGVIAGIVPALVLSKIQPALVMKDQLSANPKSRFTMRKVLITFQFVISMAFVTGAIIVYQQYRYTLNKDLGFDDAHLLNVQLFDTDFQVFDHELASFPDVQDVSYSSLIAGMGSTNLRWIDPVGPKDSLLAHYFSVSAGYLPNHDIQLVAGDNFNPAPNSNQRTILINEAFAAAIGITPAEALDLSVHLDTNLFQVIGVVRDFHYTHLEEPIGPFFLVQDPSRYAYANLKIASADITKTLSALEDIWIGLEPNHIFQASFMNEDLDRSYNFLQQTMHLFGFLAFIAITIACLGMLGMAMYTAEVKAREVSIRKILGASVWTIFQTLSVRFYRLIIMAAIIALPLIYLLFDKVILANFAFRVHIGIIELLSGAFLVFLLGMIAIGSQTWRAARVNPVDQLRKV